MALHEIQDQPAAGGDDRDDVVGRLGMVAHELRGPLDVVHNSLRLLDSELRGAADVPPRIRTLLDRLQRNTAFMARMVTDLLDFAHGEIGSIPLNRRSADLAGLTVDIVASLQESDRARVVLTCPSRADASCDPDRVAQVISNLVRNALQHGRGLVDVRVTAVSRGWTIVVENDGEIRPELAARLFHPFTRGARGGQGLGLGLYVVRRLVEAHGGATSFHACDSRVRFMVLLPHPE